jgi:hypothetical protein
MIGRKKMKKILSIMIFLVLVMPFTLGCDAVTLTPVQESNIRFLLSDEPNAINDFETVMVTVTGVGFLQAGDNGQWIEPENFVPWEGDLKTLIGTNASVVWDGSIPPGDYVKAFIYVDDITATLVGHPASCRFLNPLQ